MAVASLSTEQHVPACDLPPLQVMPLLISMAGSHDREDAGSALTALHLQVRESSQDQVCGLSCMS